MILVVPHNVLFHRLRSFPCYRSHAPLICWCTPTKMLRFPKSGTILIPVTLWTAKKWNSDLSPQRYVLGKCLFCFSYDQQGSDTWKTNNKCRFTKLNPWWPIKKPMSGNCSKDFAHFVDKPKFNPWWPIKKPMIGNCRARILLTSSISQNWIHGDL